MSINPSEEVDQAKEVGQDNGLGQMLRLVIGGSVALSSAVIRSLSQR